MMWSVNKTKGTLVWCGLVRSDDAPPGWFGFKLFTQVFYFFLAQMGERMFGQAA